MLQQHLRQGLVRRCEATEPGRGGNHQDRMVPGARRSSGENNNNATEPWTHTHTQIENFVALTVLCPGALTPTGPSSSYHDPDK